MADSYKISRVLQYFRFKTTEVRFFSRTGLSPSLVSFSKTVPLKILLCSALAQAESFNHHPPEATGAPLYQHYELFRRIIFHANNTIQGLGSSAFVRHY
jgi:hypothetical protein